MYKILSLLIIVFVSIMINTPVNAKIHNVKVGSDGRTYVFPANALHNNITSLEFSQHYNPRFSEKQQGSLFIKCKEDKDALVALYKIELITKNDLRVDETISPIQIQKVWFNEYYGLVVDFEYLIEDKLFDATRLKFYFTAREPEGDKAVEYTVDFKDI